MKSIDEWDDDFNRSPVWTTLRLALISIVAIAVCVGLIGLITTGSFFFAGEAAKHTVNSRTDVKVFTPENKVAQIAFFHDTCEDVNAQLRIAENNQARYDADLKVAQMSSDPIKQQQAQSRLTQEQQDVTGALNVVQNTVAKYNSRSAQSTANVFKDANLPSRITLPAQPESGFTINCG